MAAKHPRGPEGCPVSQFPSPSRMILSIVGVAGFSNYAACPRNHSALMKGEVGKAM